MKIYVMSQTAFNTMLDENKITNYNIESFSDCFFISINGSSELSSKLSNKENVKVMFFDDTDKDYDIPIIGTNEISHEKTFTENQAKELFEFIQKHKDKKTCYIHCRAGISKSGAVGEFINQYTDSDKEWFRQTNSQIIPNATVLNLLHRAANK